uniref:Uncharacterized protein n=1 Tax=Steinernema glaseri TaxID=37863 RepID=A0A1I7ZK93_9BILA
MTGLVVPGAHPNPSTLPRTPQKVPPSIKRIQCDMHEAAVQIDPNPTTVFYPIIHPSPNFFCCFERYHVTKPIIHLPPIIGRSSEMTPFLTARGEGDQRAVPADLLAHPRAHLHLGYRRHSHVRPASHRLRLHMHHLRHVPLVQTLPAALLHAPEDFGKGLWHLRGRLLCEEPSANQDHKASRRQD